jgi:hypothetical protein
MEENIYRKTLQVLRERGYCKEKLVDPMGRVCLAGAVNAVVLGDPSFATYVTRSPQQHGQIADALGEVGDLAEKMFPSRTRPLAGSINGVIFNNHPDTTQEDVETLLEKLAIREEEKVW